MDRPESRALTDPDDRIVDETNGEEWLALAGTTEGDDRATTLEVPRRRVHKLLGGRPEGGGLGRRRVGVVVEC